MSSTSSIPPTIPFHVAQAYGTRPAAALRAANTQASQIVAPAVAAPAAGPSAKLPSAAQKLVGATVPGRVDFSGAQPTQTTGAASLQMYRHPAEKNAAATAVSIGRSLDVRG